MKNRSLYKILRLVILGKNRQDYKDVAKLLKTKGHFSHNIHDIKDKKKYAKTWLNLQTIVKDRFILPSFLLIEKIFSRYKVKKIPNNPHNYLIKRFDKAYNQALRDWCKYYKRNGALNNKSKSVITKAINRGAYRMLKSLKEWYLSVLLMDQAYKEFHNMLMINLAKELQEEFKGKNVNHLIYNAKIVNEVNYFSLFKQIREDIKVGQHDQREK